MIYFYIRAFCIRYLFIQTWENRYDVMQEVHSKRVAFIVTTFTTSSRRG